jgi:formyltetrahydrofolate-dependent phosphoribosylglycinamide formyltransferase
MFNRLKEKWNVSWLQFTLIFCTFALGGSSCARLGSYFLNLLNLEKSLLYYIIYIPLITILWPACVLLISIPLGQFSFFKNYLQRVWSKMKGEKQNIHYLAIFASGAGSNAAKIIERFKNHSTIKVCLIVSNKKEAGVLKIAEQNQIPTLIIEKEQFFSGDAYVAALQKHKVSFIVLAGFLWKVPEKLITAFPNKIINIHPALLPKYGGKGMYGHFVHEAVIEHKEKESGITIHYVNEKYDEGKHIFQATCHVEATDTPEQLAEKIHLLEHRHFPEQIEKLLTDI